MKIYNFRVRFLKSPRTTIALNDPQLAMPNRSGDPEVTLVSRDGDKSLKDSSFLVLKSSGWSLKENAKSAGRLYFDALKRSLVRLRVGADFGKRTQYSIYTEDGLRMLQEPETLALMNDLPGLMVYESIGKTQFISTEVEIGRAIQSGQLINIFEYALNNDRELSDNENVSIELFNASFFQKSDDARFLLLMCSLEALMVVEKRSASVGNHVDTLISLTEAADGLAPHEKGALISALGNLKNESIGQTGRKLVTEKLGNRVYEGKSPNDFFNLCYKLRSQLIHGGAPLPTLEVVSTAACYLEVMVSDLLSIDLLDACPL